MSGARLSMCAALQQPLANVNPALYYRPHTHRLFLLTDQMRFRCRFSNDRFKIPTHYGDTKGSIYFIMSNDIAQEFTKHGTSEKDMKIRLSKDLPYFRRLFFALDEVALLQEPVSLPHDVYIHCQSVASLCVCRDKLLLVNRI